jgi:pilus assembly protein CpaB
MAPIDSPGGLQALVPEGMRAVTVEVNESSGIAGLLVPGARVDVIATLRDGQDTVAKTIVENVRVTAVGRRLVRDPRDDPSQAVRTVTLVMRPMDAEAVQLATTYGRPRLVLRGPADNTPTVSEGVSMSELVGSADHPNAVNALAGPAPTPPPPPAAVINDDAFGPPATRPSVAFESSMLRKPVQMIRGGQESTVYYEVRNPKANGSSAVNDSLPPMGQ